MDEPEAEIESPFEPGTVIWVIWVMSLADRRRPSRERPGPEGGGGRLSAPGAAESTLRAGADRSPAPPRQRDIESHPVVGHPRHQRPARARPQFHKAVSRHRLQSAREV